MIRRRRMLEDTNSERKTMEFTNLLKSITDSLQGIQSCCDSLLGYCDNISEDFNEIMFDSNYPMSDRQLNRTLTLYIRELQKLERQVYDSEENLVTVLGTLSSISSDL